MIAKSEHPAVQGRSQDSVRRRRKSESIKNQLKVLNIPAGLLECSALLIDRLTCTLLSRGQQPPLARTSLRPWIGFLLKSYGACHDQAIISTSSFTSSG